MKKLNIVKIAVIIIFAITSSRCSRSRSKLWNNLNKEAAKLYDQGKYVDAQRVAKNALEIAETFGKESEAVAVSMNNLAAFYQAEGKYGEAEPLLKRALEIWEKVLGGSSPDVAMALNNLAELYRIQERYHEAEPLYKRALTIDKKVYGENNPTVARDLNNLGLLYDNQKKYNEAESLYKQSLAIREKVLGLYHADVGVSLVNLAALYMKNKDSKHAEPLLKRAEEIWEKIYGPNHPITANVYHNLGWLYQMQGKYTQAELFYEKALSIRRNNLAGNHPDLIATLKSLSMLYKIMKSGNRAGLLIHPSPAEEGLYIREKLDEDTIKINELNLIIKKPKAWIFHRSQAPYNLLVITKGEEIKNFEPFVSITVNPDSGEDVDNYFKYVMDYLASGMKTKTLVTLGGIREINVAGCNGRTAMFIFNISGRKLIVTAVVFIKDAIGYAISYQNEDKNILLDGNDYNFILENMRFNN